MKTHNSKLPRSIYVILTLVVITNVLATIIVLEYFPL